MVGGAELRCWFESGESVVLGPDIVQQTTEKVKLIQEKNESVVESTKELS